MVRNDTSPRTTQSRPPTSIVTEMPFTEISASPGSGMPRRPIAPASGGAAASTSSRSIRMSALTRPNVRPRTASSIWPPSSVSPTTYASPAKAPSSSVASTARASTGTSASTTRQVPAAVMVGPRTRRRDRSPSAIGPSATPAAMPTKTVPNSRA